jgi:hypothetical protein
VHILDDRSCPCNRGARTARASHVEPDNILLRVIFHLLRQWLGDKGHMSEFTRSWKCLWRVNMKPVGGPILCKYNRPLRSFSYQCAVRIGPISQRVPDCIEYHPVTLHAIHFTESVNTPFPKARTRFLFRAGV